MTVANSSASLRIDRFLLQNAAHLELAVLDCKAEPPFHEVERVLAELLEAPPGKNPEAAADSCGKRFEIVRARDQARRDARFLCANLEQQLEQVADQRTFLGQSRPLRLAVRK